MRNHKQANDSGDLEPKLVAEVTVHFPHSEILNYLKR